MKKAIALLLSLFVSIASLSINATAEPYTLNLSAECAVLIDSDSREVLFEKNSKRQRGMASTTKIMTALVAAECGDVNRTVSVSEKAVGVEGSSIYLYAGEQFTLLELLYALMLRSANDAAAAIAIELGDSIEGFADMMNAKALSMGLENTHFTNPHGLYDKDHYTSAYDLALISSELLKNETLRTIVSTKKITIPFYESSDNTRLLVNHNKMLKLYDGAIGVKTGFTKATGRCLVSAAERDGLTLIAVTLNAPDDWNDHTKMLDFGFSQYESVKIADAASFFYSLPLTGGENDKVTLANVKELRATLPKDRGKITLKVEAYHRFEFAPVYRGTPLGRVVCLYNGKEIAESALVCTDFTP